MAVPDFLPVCPVRSAKAVARRVGRFVLFDTLFNKLNSFGHNIIENNSDLPCSSLNGTKRTFTGFDPVIKTRR